MRPVPAVPARLSGLTLLAAVLLAPAAQAVEPRAFDDAALFAVQFVDHNEGWAVGDEGAVWHTIDGGRNWDRQSTGVRAALKSLHFLNPYTGWVAGREELPGGGSAGVLLYTQDGGVAWQRVLPGALPGLNVVRFADERVGYLAGDGSDAAPSGVWVTRDSGRTWQAVPGPRAPSWLAAAFTADGGALGGAWNRLAAVRPERVTPADVDSLGGRSVCGLFFLGRAGDRQRGVAVGQGGLVLLSDGPAGKSWAFPPDLPLSPEVRADWDLHAVHGAGTRLWAVGRPGSAVLHSRDGGARWELQATGQPLPLHGVFFVDETHGWAVGELGTVLATADAGKSWQVQRRGGQRCAALLLHASAAGTPLDAVALLGAEEGYLTAALRLTAPDPASASPARAADADRHRAAVRQAGGAAGEMLWAFPLGSHLAAAGRDDLLRCWDGLHGGRAADQLLRQIVLALRTWRPDVVLTDSPDGAGAGALVAEAVREAFARAGEPKAFPEQINDLGLEPWRPAKVYACWEGRAEAAVTLDLASLRPCLEASLRDFAAGPSALLGAAALPAERRFRLLCGSPDAALHRDLMQGVSLAPGGLARRRLPERPEPDAEALRRLRQRAALQALETAEGSPVNLASPERLLAQIAPLLAEMPDDQAAQTAHLIAQRFVRLGQWGLARDTFLLLAERYPAHPLAAEACRWLIRHNSSSEARRRHELGQFIVLEGQQPAQPGAAQRVVPLGKAPVAADGPAAAKPGQILQVANIEEQRRRDLLVPGGGDLARQWYQGSLDLEAKLAAFGPLFAADPGIQFCLQSARRNLGDLETPRQWYRQFVARQPDGPWRAAAAAELWLSERGGACPKPLAHCRPTDKRPFLDGNLDDACWQDGQPLRLSDAAGQTVADSPTEVRLCYDSEYLYVAVRCFHSGGRQVSLARPRSHDADLRQHDRVSLLLDLDRDYSTCYHLQFDERGCVAEDCWGDRTWDPRWFVAVRHEARCWIAEIAIPLSALSGDGVAPGRAWAFNAVRVLPGRGVQAWSLPAEAPEEALRPEGLGLLLFAQAGQNVAEGGAPAMPRAH
jgi:photosystem II stability/assembly factor-like uncharacterized protein